ncbi:MAG: RICIN domain-containing protein, partial [Clostridia bacterium]
MTLRINPSASIAIAAAMIAGMVPQAVIFAEDTVPVATVQAVQTSIDPFDNAYNVIVNESTGRVITVQGMDNMAKITVEEAASDYSKANATQIWRLAPLADGLCYAVNQKSGRSLDVPDAKKEDGVQLIQYSYNGNSQQKMKFEKDGDAYTISPSHAETYLADDDGKLVQISDKNSANAKWRIITVAPSMMASVKDSAGYAMLGADQKRAFDNYFYSKLDFSRSVRNSAETLLCTKNYNALSPRDQMRVLTTALTYTAFGQVTGNVVNETPAEYKIVSTERVENFDIWRGSRTTCWVYQVEMAGDVEGQVHKFQFVSNEEKEDAEMVTKSIEALGVFPYALRQYVHNLYWKKGDTANSYNGGGNSIWIRLTWEPSRQQISQTLSHELGHVLEQNMLNDPDVWSLAERLDACPISSYGSSNETEDLAEFSRTYWTNLGKDTFDEIEKVYPNRLKVFRGLLYRADNEYFKDYAEDEKFIEELTRLAREAGSDSDCSKLDETKLYKIVDPLTDKV